MAAKRDSSGRFIKGSGGGGGGGGGGGSKSNPSKELESFFNKAKKALPFVFESSIFEAAEVAAIHLDKSTRLILNRNSTGSLANSWNPVLNGPLSAGAYSDLPYAAIHETGGVIKPNRAKALAVPLTRGARNAGSPRNMGNLSFFPSFGGRSPLLVKIGKGVAVPQYALMKSVTIPARNYISFAMTSSADEINEIIGRGVIDLFAGKSSVFGVS